VRGGSRQGGDRLTREGASAQRERIIVRCRGLVGGRAEGEALVSSQPLGFWGELDPGTGVVTDVHHEWRGREVTGKVLVFPRGRGSTGGAGIFLEAVRRGRAPAALVNVETEMILLAGPILAAKFYGRVIPVVDRPERDPTALIEAGDHVVVDGDRGIIEVTKRKETGSTDRV